MKYRDVTYIVFALENEVLKSCFYEFVFDFIHFSFDLAKSHSVFDLYVYFTVSLSIYSFCRNRIGDEMVRCGRLECGRLFRSDQMKDYNIGYLLLLPLGGQL